MHPLKREMFLAIWNNHKPVDDVTIPLFYLDSHLPNNMIMPALVLLLKKGITGSNFVEWFNTKCKSSNLEMHREIKRMLKKDLELKPLFASEDLRA